MIWCVAVEFFVGQGHPEQSESLASDRAIGVGQPVEQFGHSAGFGEKLLE